MSATTKPCATATDPAYLRLAVRGSAERLTLAGTAVYALAELAADVQTAGECEGLNGSRIAERSALYVEACLAGLASLGAEIERTANDISEWSDAGQAGGEQ